MASPQPDKHTRISNELLEAIYRYPFTSNELRFVLFLLRMTYGYHRKVINLRTNEIAKGTGINKVNINRVVNSLLLSSIITRNQVDYKHGATYGIQKDYDKWKLRKKKLKRVIKLITKSNQVDNSGSITPSSIKEKRKENNSTRKKSNNRLPTLSTLKTSFPWLNIDLWNEFRAMRIKIKKPMTPYAEKLRIGDLKKLIEKGYTQEQIVNKSISSGWQDFYEPKDKPIKNSKITHAGDMSIYDN